MKTMTITLALMGLMTMPAGAAPATTHKTIPEVAAAAGSFDGLLKAVKSAGLAETLSGTGPFTVFAPPNSAFAKLPKGVLTELLAPANRDALRGVLLAHVVSGRVESPSLLFASEITTVSGVKLPVEYREGRLTVGGATVVTADIRCANGVIHVIDTVITPPAPVKTTPNDILVLAIDRGVPLFNDGQPEACAAIYEIAARSVVALSGDALHSRDRQVLVSALERAEKMNGAKLKAWELRRAFDQVLHSEEETMTTRDAGNAEKIEKTETALRDAPAAKDDFRVTMEAPLPAGFPGPGPVGQVVLKEYPSYRMARSSGGSAFGSLFMHIKRNDISMTAPVEMTMQAEDDGELRQQDMAFLYESSEQGRAGRDGSVTVMDHGSVKVLSIGLRGPLSARKMSEAKRSVEAQLAKAEGWVRNGDWRLMGYNSPFIPASQRFYELQLPVQEHDHDHDHDHGHSPAK